MEITQNQKIANAVITLRPNAQWSLLGDDYADINWLDKNQTKPTLAEVEAEIANPTPQPELTVADKLANAGLSVNELKAALGL
tara:strand:- start:449 stop:697 length:249 start_codon:yes stop_codon:yes gene_type:complete